MQWFIFHFKTPFGNTNMIGFIQNIDCNIINILILDLCRVTNVSVQLCAFNSLRPGLPIQARYTSVYLRLALVLTTLGILNLKNYENYPGDQQTKFM